MKNILLYLAMVLASAGIISTMSPVLPTAAAEGKGNCNDVRFLTFPAWYRGLAEGDVPDCTITSPGGSGEFGKSLTSYIMTIVLNVLEIMLQLVVYICAGFIIWGGFMYLTSAGSSDGISSGKKMILNAIVGLVISLFAAIAVSFIVGRLNL